MPDPPPAADVPPKPRVLLVIATLDAAGAEKQFTLLACGLKARGWDVHAVALTRGGPHQQALEAAGVPVTVLGKRLKVDPTCLWRLRGMIGRLKPDLIHSWMFTANTHARLVAGDVPVIVGERCVDRWKGGVRHEIDRRLLKRNTARVVANSHAVADFLTRHGTPEDGVTVIPNGIEPLEPDPAFRADLLRSLALPADAAPVTYAGRFAPQKRPGDLVWAFQLLYQTSAPAVHLMAGDGPLRQRCEDLIAHYGHGMRARVLGRRDDARRVIAASSVFWLASEYEGQSNALMEAMAAGVPPVVSDIPSNRELVTDGETGYLVPVGDPLGFAQWADRLIADPNLAAEIGTAAREKMRAGFTIDAMVTRYERLYEEVLAEDRA